MASWLLFIAGALLALFSSSVSFEGRLSDRIAAWLIVGRMWIVLVGGALMLFGAFGVPW